MKKQIKKLSLNKKTISNLQSSEMVKIGGGYWTVPCHSWGCPPQTQNGKKTCNGHNTCQYTCA